MKIEYRSQTDGLGDKVSADSAVFFDPDEDVTRQEYKAETEIDFILQRYGLPTGQGRYGEVDQSVDLQEAIRLRGELDAAFTRLPEPIRRQYGSWAAVIAAADRGEIRGEDLRVVSDEQDKALGANEPKGE